MLHTLSAPPQGLVDTAGLLKTLWVDPATAPCGRSIDRLRRRGVIPFVKLGHLVYFNPAAVLEALQSRSGRRRIT